MNPTWISLGVLAAMAPSLHRRIQLSRAKHRSLAGHSRMAKRLARWLPGYGFDEAEFFGSDGAPANIQAQRHAAFFALGQTLQTRHRLSIEATAAARENISDMQFIAAYRVPFQFSPVVREHLKVGSFLQSAHGVHVTDLDGQVFYDLTGSYGVNVFGADFYKRTMAEGMARTQALGPVLGSYHPVVADNVRRLRGISGLDEISFHMSGTEAVMQAVRLARYHTNRSHLVRFCGAYHGWWGDVQPGIGNPSTARDTYTLADMSARTLQVLRRRRDIACVLVNPLQALHPNQAAPADSSLVDSGRSAGFDREAYTAWLRELRQVCDERGIVLIFDEIFVGFRLAMGGAKEYFGVQPDLITYGKTLGGGLPVGVLCGRRALMKRYSAERPVDVCFARGTFNAHPYVMGAMAAFLQHMEQPSAQALYDGLDDLWNERTERLNARLRSAEIPVRVENLSSIWTICYTRPSRYNWMLQYYLRAEGLALSWVGTGRLIFSLNYTDADFDAVVDRFTAACVAMRADGWWWADDATTNRSIKRRILREMWANRRFLTSSRPAEPSPMPQPAE